MSTRPWSYVILLIAVALAGLAGLRLALPVQAAPLAAQTLPYPAGTAPCNTTLQACIDGASAGDTVAVGAGTFITDQIVINEAITLSGAGSASTILQAVSGQRVISVSANLTAGVVIANLTIQGGDVLSDAGGGLYSGFGTPLKLTGVVVRNNTATGSGGGVYVADRATVVDSRFEGNTGEFGGGMWASLDAEITGSEFENNVATGDAGGFFANGTLVTVTASSFISNAAARSAGGLWAEDNALVSATDFLSNTAGATAGGLQVNGGSAVVSGGQFMGNHVGPEFVDTDEQGGGGLYSSGPLTLTGVIFSGNTSEGDGGGLSGTGPVAIAGGHFEGNETSNSGGAVYGEALVQVDSTLFLDNEAGFGAGIYTNGRVVITATDFLSNTADAYGGGVFESQGPSRVTGGRFEGNQALLVLPGETVGGGGLYNDGGLLTIDGAIFRNNSAGEQGGGVLGNEFATLQITNSTFLSNSARYGGGVAAAGVATVTNSSFVSNTASSEGGALSSSGHSFIAGSQFDRNQATDGGALWLGVLNGNEVDRSIFSRNVAAEDGGAMFVADSTALTLTNSLLVSNTAGNEGGALASNSPGLYVFNVTLAANQAITGGGILVRFGNLDLGNSILWANSPNQIGHNDPLTLTGPNLIQGGAFGSLDQDPRFVRNPNPAAGDLGDLRLRQDSPAVDRGDNARLPAGLTLDLDGQPRRFDVAAVTDTGSGTAPLVDLGAYEVNNQLPSAEANGPYTGVEGTAVPLSGSGSTSGDTGQAIAAFAWDCTGDGSFEVTASSPTGSSCTYPDQGNFTVRLRISDTGGFTAEDTAAVSVQNVAPVVTGPGSQTATQGQATQFTLGSFADPGPDAPWLVTVAWGDGQTSNFTRTVTGSLPAASHTYALTGTFNAGVTVSDKDGDVGSAGFAVVVTPPPGDVEGVAVIDTNGNGVADGGEPPLEGATVTLTGPTGSASAAAADLTRTTTTNPQGVFRFDDVEPGTYSLTIAKAGFVAAGPITVDVQPGQLTQVEPVGVTPVPDETNEIYLPHVRK